MKPLKIQVTEENGKPFRADDNSNYDVEGDRPDILDTYHLPENMGEIDSQLKQAGYSKVESGKLPAPLERLTYHTYALPDADRIEAEQWKAELERKY